VKGTSKFLHFKVLYTEPFIVRVQKYTKGSQSKLKQFSTRMHTKTCHHNEREPKEISNQSRHIVTKPV